MKTAIVNLGVILTGLPDMKATLPHA